MRILTASLAIALLPYSALVADAADYMRGPMYDPPQYSNQQNWAGTYFGGHGGFTQQRLRTVTGVLSAPNNPGLEIPFNTGSGSMASYGGFIGFNAQWEEVVLGFEFTYSRMDKALTSSRSFATPYTFDPNVGPVPAIATGVASQRITDLFGGRVRAGWDAGWLMPYATVGVVVARGQSERFGSVVEIAPPNAFRSGSLSSLSATPFGFSAGLGVDIAITANIFARAELEYVGLRESKGLGGQMTTARGGIGYRF